MNCHKIKNATKPQQRGEIVLPAMRNQIFRIAN